MTQKKSEKTAGRRLAGGLIRGSFGSALVRITGRVLALAIGVVLARNLGADGYGIYAYVLAWLTIVSIFSEIGASTMLIRGIAANNAERHWAKLRGLLSDIASAVAKANSIVIAVSALCIFAVQSFLDESLRQTFWTAILLLPFVVMAKLSSASLIGFRKVVAGDAIENVVRPSIFLLLVVSTFAVAPDFRSAEAAMALQVVAAAVAVLIALVLLRKHLSNLSDVTPNRDHGQNIVSSAFSLTLLASAGLINGQTDILMLGFFRPADEIGVYRVATQGAALVPIGVQIVGVVYAPRFAKSYTDGDIRELQKLVAGSAKLMLAIAIPIAAVFVLYGGEIAGMLFGAEFTAVHVSLAILSFGLLCNVATGPVGVLLRMTGHEKQSAQIMFGSAGLNVLMNAALIPRYGLIGAAVATSITSAISHIALCWVVRSRVGISSLAFSTRSIR